MSRENLLSLLRHTVDIYDDANKSGSLVGADGHAKPVYRPVDGLSGVACWVSLPSDVGLEVSSQPGGKATGKVVFSENVDLDLTARLKWNQSPHETTQWLEVVGICTPKFVPNDPVNPHHWSANISVLSE